MTNYREDVAYALRLLRQGYTPEEVEEVLERHWALTALTDPTNVLLQEVNDDGTTDSARSR